MKHTKVFKAPIPGGHYISLRLLAMKLSLLLILLTCLPGYGKSFAQEKLRLQLRDGSLRQVLKAVEQQSNYRFVFHNETLPVSRKVSISVTDATLEQVLDQVFQGTGLSYTVKDDGLVVIHASGVAAQQAVTVSGVVTGADNEVLPGVTIRVSGTQAGTMTDGNGRYNLPLPEGAATLEFSLVGYVKQQIAIEHRRVINVSLQLDVRTLNSVTVTSYASYTRNRSASAAAVVGSDKINQVPMATVDQVLQGRVAGLNVSSGSGQPGTAAKVVLRGVGTINGNSSLLYIVDGVPVESNYLQAINPADIASVTVLKDASSKAQYGSRGSNGVMVITTKKGTAGKLALEYRSQYGFSKMTTSRTTMMNTQERLQFEKEIGRETGKTIGPGWAYSKDNPEYATLPVATQQRYDFMLDSIGKVNANWRDLLLRTGRFMEQQVSASGGNEQVRFYTSLNYFKQDGIVMRSGLERLTLKNNLDINAGRLTGNLNLSLGYAASSFIEREGSSKIANPLAATMYALPYEYPYAADGTMILPNNASQYNSWGDQEGAVALEGMQNTSNKTNQIKGILSGSLNYSLGAGFTVKTRVGIDFRENTNQRYINPDSYSGSRVDNGQKGAFGEGVNRNFGLITTSGLTYAKQVGDVHDIEVSGFYEYNTNQLRAFGYEGYGINGKLPETPAGITPGAPDNGFIPTLSGSREQRGLASWIAVGRYTFMNRYTLNASYRRDGSSTVPATNRWHGFYSVGVSWEAKQESFLANVKGINDLRFRVSYGTTASPFDAAFGYAATFGITSYGGVSGIRPIKPGYDAYNWEYAKEFNAGFDLAVLNSRLRLIVDVYNKQTSNLFLEQPLSLTSGFTSQLLNTGSMRNRGIEVDIQGDVIKQKNFSWNVGLNFAYNKNTITDLGTAGEFEQGTTGIVRVGMPYGTHYAPKWAGVDPKTGDPLYYTRDGQKTANYNFSALSVAEFGTYIPPLTGGFSTGVNWKGIYLNALFSFAAKTYRYNNEDYYNENPSFYSSNQSTRMLYDRWKQPGDNATLPKFSAKRSFSSRDIQDASYIRLRNVNLGYNVPAVLLSKLKYVKGVHVFVQAQNLLTWTKWKGFDPEDDNGEAMFDYPSARTYTAGLNINF